MPSGTLVNVSSIVPSAPPHVVGSVVAPNVTVGNAGSVNVTSISSKDVQPDAVMVISLYTPLGKALIVAVPPLTAILLNCCGTKAPST